MIAVKQNHCAPHKQEEEVELSASPSLPTPLFIILELPDKSRRGRENNWRVLCGGGWTQSAAMTGKSVKDVDRYQAVLNSLLALEENKYCADCESK
ncbi:hypothetical protein CRENBAI_003372, partial [Crenichthys baileyi]